MTKNLRDNHRLFEQSAQRFFGILVLIGRVRLTNDKSDATPGHGACPNCGVQ